MCVDCRYHVFLQGPRILEIQRRPDERRRQKASADRSDLVQLYRGGNHEPTRTVTDQRPRRRLRRHRVPIGRPSAGAGAPDAGGRLRPFAAERYVVPCRGGASGRPSRCKTDVSRPQRHGYADSSAAGLS